MNAVTMDLSDYAARFLSVARYCGEQEDGKGGKVDLWTLKAPLGRHPVNSTLARATIDALLLAEEAKRREANG